MEGPDSDKISEFMKMKLPEGLEADDIEIQAAQNVGDEIEPVYRTRVKLELELTDDVAKQVDTVGDHPVVKIVKKKGAEFPAIAFLRSTPIGSDDWKIQMERLEYKQFPGKALSSFDNYVIDGSAEEKKAVEEKKAADAKEKREAEAKLAEARRHYVGNWQATQPMTHYGSVWTRGGHQIGIKLTLAAGDNGFGTGTATLYDFNRPSISATGKINYLVKNNGDSATITHLERIQNPDLPFSASSGSTWRLTSDGEMSNRGWKFKLEK